MLTKRKHIKKDHVCGAELLLMEAPWGGELSLYVDRSIAGSSVCGV